MCPKRCSSGTWAVRRRRIITNNEEEMLMRTLKDVTVGETVNVVKLRGTGAVKRRIMDMGITRGAQIYVRKVAPLGDPVEVNVRGYELTVRRADAEMVEIE
jgi:ferrous iron transport protein A